MKVYLCDKISKRVNHFGYRLLRDLTHLYFLKGVDITNNIESKFDYAHFIDISQRKEILYVRDILKRKVAVDYFVNKKKNKNSGLSEVTIPFDDRKILNKCNLVIVSCNADKMILIANDIKTPIEVMPLPINEERFTHVSDLEKNSFFQFAGLLKDDLFGIATSTYKDLKDVQNLVEIAKRSKNLKIFVFGPKISFFKTPHSIRNAIKKAPNNIRFRSFINEDLFKSAMLLSKFYIAPSNADLEILTVLEAMITKTQIFTFNSHYLGDILIDNKNCLYGCNPTEIVSQINSFLSNDISTVDEAYEYAKKNSYHSSSEILERILLNYVELDNSQ